jgi:hypothetical protein
MRFFASYFLMIASVPALAAVARGADVTLDKRAQVYKGGSGIIVTIAAVTPPETKKALIKIEGGGEAWERRVREHGVRKTGNRTEYLTRREGRTGEWVTLTTGNEGERPMTFLYLSTVYDGLRMTYDAALSEKVDTAALAAEYKNQKPLE